MTSLTRGSLAPAVYWRRRLAVLGIVALLVVGLTRMFGGDDGDPGEKAANVSAPLAPATSPSPTATGAADPSAGPSAGPSGSPSAGAAGAPVTPPAATPTVTSTPALPAPTGRCSDDDIVVTPSVTDAQATRTVLVHLTLRTLVTPACTWHTSARALQLKITSGSDRIWSTIDCPRAVPAKDVVVRRDTDVVVDVPWSSRRSDETCSSHTQWAMPGYYHVAVAALGGEPQDVQFALTKPRPAPKPTPTPNPTPRPTPTAGTPAATEAPTTGARQEPQTDPTRKKKRRYVD